MVSFDLDGRPVTIEPSAAPTLLETLRDHLGATSPKAGCEIGRCGACVVLLDGRPVNACLVPLDRLEGRRVVTRDGLDAAQTAPIVEALRTAGAVQCGACAPGLIVSLAFLRQRSPIPTAAEAEIALVGHLCRCSGYAGLRRALSMLFPEAG